MKRENLYISALQLAIVSQLYKFKRLGFHDIYIGIEVKVVKTYFHDGKQLVRCFLFGSYRWMHGPISR